MTQPFSRIPDPGNPSPFRRRFQPGVVEQGLRAGLREAQRGMKVAQRYCEGLWQRGRRNPRILALIGGTVAVTLVGAYALNASGAGRSLCPPPAEAKYRKTPPFLLLVDPVIHPAAGSELEIHYDVCGLVSGTAYRGRVQLSQQQRASKKTAAKPKSLVVTFQDKVDGPATRRSREVDLGSTKPGAYTLEFSVVDNRGRERKKIQKVVLTAD